MKSPTSLLALAMPTRTVIGSAARSLQAAASANHRTGVTRRQARLRIALIIRGSSSALTCPCPREWQVFVRSALEAVLAAAATAAQTRSPVADLALGEALLLARGDWSRGSLSGHCVQITVHSAGMHPGWLRCSSFKYSRYARSSRLASRAPPLWNASSFTDTSH